MLDLFLKLIDRLLELRHVEERREAKTFEALVQPAFAELTRIHQAYLDAFTSCLAVLARPDSTTAEVARDLLAEANRCEASRRRVVVLADELSTRCEHEPMRQFFQCVRRYFSRSDVRFTTHFSETMALADSGSKPVVEDAMKATLAHIRTHWDEVCRAYSEAAQVAVRREAP